MYTKMWITVNYIPLCRVTTWRKHTHTHSSTHRTRCVAFVLKAIYACNTYFVCIYIWRFWSNVWPAHVPLQCVCVCRRGVIWGITHTRRCREWKVRARSICRAGRCVASRLFLSQYIQRIARAMMLRDGKSCVLVCVCVSDASRVAGNARECILLCGLCLYVYNARAYRRCTIAAQQSDKPKPPANMVRAIEPQSWKCCNTRAAYYSRYGMCWLFYNMVGYARTEWRAWFEIQ